MQFSGNVRLVTLGGSTAERIAGRSAIAESQVSIDLATEDKRDKCLAELEASDRRLAMGAIRPTPYDWQFVFEEALADGGFRVHFGVAWYDHDFYAKNKDIFTDPRHRKIFSRFGADLDDVEVSHWVREAVER